MLYNLLQIAYTNSFFMATDATYDAILKDTVSTEDSFVYNSSSN